MALNILSICLDSHIRELHNAFSHPLYASHVYIGHSVPILCMVLEKE